MLAKQLQTCIYLFFLTNSIHIDTDLLPFLIIADSSISYTFRPWSWHRISAATPLHMGQALHLVPIFVRAVSKTSL